MSKLVYLVLLSVVVSCQEANFNGGTDRGTKKNEAKRDDNIEIDPQGPKKNTPETYGDPVKITQKEFDKIKPEPLLDGEGDPVKTSDGQPIFIDEDGDRLVFVDEPIVDIISESVDSGDPFDDSKDSIQFDDGEINFIKTTTVAVVFEDSFKEKNWEQRDIRICVKGKFAFKADTRTIRGGSKKSETIEVNAYKNPSAGCSHRFKVQVKKTDGTYKAEQSFDTAANDNFNKASVSLAFGETLEMSWTKIAGGVCFDGPILHTDTQSPAPKIFTDSCGDFNP